jgi:predicted permease
MWRWIRQWRRREREDAELAEELRAHLAIDASERMESGEGAEEARQAAHRDFGNVTQIYEDTRETWGWPAFERFLEDARFGLRLLLKTPGWTAIIACTLAMGIGLSTAIFSVVYGVLLEPLPYPGSGRIVALWPSAPKHGYPRFSVSAALWLHWRERSKLFGEIALTRPLANYNLTGDGPPERLEGARTSANLAEVLGAQPLAGRFFSEEERRRDARVALLSYALWQRRFGGDLRVLGRKIELSGEPYEVIGIMPPYFRYPTAAFEIWTPLYIPPDEIRDGINNQYMSVGRLKSGVSVPQAQAEMSAIMQHLAEEYPAGYRAADETVGVLVEPLVLSDAFQIRSALYVLLAAVGCLLLIGCMNLGVLLIARAAARNREMAMRAALGASAARLRRQIIAEVLPLGVAGATGGIQLAFGMLSVILRFLPAGTPRVQNIGLHLPVLAFAAGISLLVVFLAALLPARISSQATLAHDLQQSSRTVAGGGMARNALVGAQVAVTIVLLIAGALFVRSLAAVLRVNPGFSTQSVLTMHLVVARAKYESDAQVAEYYRQLLARVQSIPGVMAAGIVNRLPLSGIAQTAPVEFEGIPGGFDADTRSATPGYFEALRIPLENGRLFAETDRAGSPAVGIIDERIAHKAFGSSDPIGRHFRFVVGSVRGPWTEIVGVVGHILNDSPELDYRPQVYWPESQRTQDRGALVARTTGHAESFTPAIVEQIHKEDPDQPVYDIRTMDQWLEQTVQSRKLMTGLVVLFGSASLLLACLGLYGVVSYTAGLRLREFGIRMALGATGGNVRLLVLGHAGKLALLGAGIGLALALPASRALRSLLFGISSRDAVSWIAVPVLLILVALVAGLGPAARAGRTDPAVTLRAE